MTSSTTVRERQQRVLTIVLAINAVFLVVEVVGGVVFGSLALLADAAHLLSDVAGLAIALAAHRLLTRPASTRHSFGLQRAEVLGAQANGVILVATSGWIVVAAVRRLGDTSSHHVDGGGMLVVALLGLVANVIGALALARVEHGSLNLHGAVVHLAADAVGSIAAVLAGVAVVVAGATWVDPVASIVIALLVVGAAWGLLRDATRILLEGTPKALDPDDVRSALARADGVVDVHHLHVWSLASDTPALSAHVVLDGEPSLHDAQERGDRLRTLLADRFGIAHATLELECHGCDD
ncbi:MAG TPA: cation diffusion facilitator family transporter [Acidimicrobiales bacterium]|nr:cation diffusion facilitator family transporter [Acidimicrobiales bacterium]